MIITIVEAETAMADLHDELLTGLSLEELQILAEGMLSPRAQNQLEDWLSRNADNQLSVDEAVALDSLLIKIDYLNVLRTRARYTLGFLQRTSVAS